MTERQQVPLGHWRLPEGVDVRGVGSGLGRTRRRMRAVARELRLPPLSTAEELCAAVSAHLGRPIRIEPRRMRVGEPSGFVERLSDEDVVHVEQETSGLHRAHIVCHELAHLLCGHLSEPALLDPALLGPDGASVDLPTIDPEMLRLVLGRSHYDDAAEEEAEVLGAELMRLLVLAPGAGTTSQLAPALEHRKGQHV
ncbi:hypothetical protein [Kitasatospora sp. NPDC088134]|uniref:hypothetical protein n=1 Tax=Kitasatospora sp. NPDC088134 TaxID=3364071 RepID=UPI003801411C